MRDSRATILRQLDLGYLPRRMEDWAVSGAQRRIVYSYPLLDRRLVEFALATPSGTPQRLLFIGSLADLLPREIDWTADQGEPATLAALGKETRRRACGMVGSAPDVEKGRTNLCGAGTDPAFH